MRVSFTSTVGALVGVFHLEALPYINLSGLMHYSAPIGIMKVQFMNEDSSATKAVLLS